jgi:putative transposase
VNYLQVIHAGIFSINRGHARETVFHDDEDRARFLQLLAEYRDRFELRIYHYCVMGNHFHVLLQLPDPRGVSRVMAGLLVAYWHHYRLRLGLVGHLFQGRFKSPAVEADEYLLSCGRYIERNPLEAHLATEPWDYPWSSCRAYALGTADGLLAPNPWYEAFGADAASCQAPWRAFLVGDDVKEDAVRREDWLIGGEAFRKKIDCSAARPAPRKRGRPIGIADPAQGRINP